MANEPAMLGPGNKLLYVVDLDAPYSHFEKNKLLKMNDMAQFIWDVQHRILFDAKEMNKNQLINAISKSLEEHGLIAEELTF
jgi:hypothetical protein